MNATHQWQACRALRGHSRRWLSPCLPCGIRHFTLHATEEGPGPGSGGGGGTGTDSGLLYLCTLDFSSRPIFLCPKQKADLSKQR